MLVKLQSAISLVTCGCLVSLAASPSNVGFVVTSGHAQVDGLIVRGNSTLFQGSLVQAVDATSDLVFSKGSNLLLQPGSAANVYREYAILRSGTATQHGSGYVFADGMRVSSLSPQGAILVGVKDRSHFEVNAQGSAAEVRNATGALVARLEAGKALSFTIQDQQPGPSSAQPNIPPSTSQNPPPTAAGQAPTPVGTQLTIHGIVRKDHAGRYGHYLLTDLATNVTYELQGSGLDDLVGGSVEVTGSIFDTKPAEGASRVLSVSDIHQMPLSEMTGTTTATAPPAAAPAEAPPSPAGDTIPSNTAGPEVGATPEATAPPDVSTAPAAPATPPIAVHSDTAKILIIVGLAAGVGVGVALGLAGGKSSTVSPE